MSENPVNRARVTNGPFEGGSYAPATQPTDVRASGFSNGIQLQMPNVTSTNVNMARQNRGSNVQIPYSRVVPLHDRVHRADPPNVLRRPRRTRRTRRTRHTSVCVCVCGLLSHRTDLMSMVVHRMNTTNCTVVSWLGCTEGIRHWARMPHRASTMAALVENCHRQRS